MSTAVAGRRGTAALVLEGMRPEQFSKNAFVLAGLLFSGEVVDPSSTLRALTVTVAFCAASGASYLVNDAVDAPRDRLNPRTASRPVARGALAPGTARGAAVLLAVVALGLGAVINLESLATVAGFLALQVAYSSVLKHVLFVDVLAIAAGFVLRALAGLVAIDVEISSYLLLCTGLLALFLGLTKRRAEAVAIGGEDHPQRPVLEHYSVALIDELIAVITPTTVVAYALYAISRARTDAMLLTLPFVIYGIFRVLFLIHRTTVTDEPAVIVWRDRPLLACVALWIVAAGVISVASA